MADIAFFPAGDSAVVVQFGSEIAESVNRRIARFTGNVENARIKGVRELIPTFCTVSVLYDPCIIGYEKLVRTLRTLLPGDEAASGGQRTVHVVPVCYGGAMGEDLPFVASHAGLSEEEVISIHSGRDYLIYMLGFTPGFTYLGGLNEKIHTPRLTQPRVKIPGGSVGIAGSQTGVYPIDSPGGWQLIGRTPVKLYDPNRAEPILPRAGQYIKFRAVDQAEFDEISRQVEAGTYQCVSYPRKEAE